MAPFQAATDKAIRRQLVPFFRLQRQRLLRYLHTGQKDLSAPLPASIPPWTDLGLGTLDLAHRMTPLITATWDAAGGKFLSKIGLDADEWSVTNPHTAAAIQQATLAFCDSTNQTTSLALDEALAKTREALHEGLVEEGEALPELTKRINAIFDKAETWRARRIAWTEASRAVHAAQEQAAVESGVVTGWKWLVSSDACPICVAIAARAPAVKLGDAFAVIGFDVHYAKVKYPPAHPHCNCTVTEVLDTDEQPEWSRPLFQPEAASEEETERIAREIAERDEAILSGSSPPGKPPKKPRGPARPKPSGDGIPRFVASKAKVHPLVDQPAVLDAIKQTFGKRKTMRQLIAAIGAPDDSEVHFSTSANGDIYYRVLGPKIQHFEGSIERRREEVLHYLIRYNTAPELRGQRVGTAIHGRMVEWGAKLGIDQIEMIASRGTVDVGYMVWPILGYDGPLPEKILKALPAYLRDARTVQDVLKTPRGRDWWHDKGDSFQATFELAPGSPSRRLWADYWTQLPKTEKDKVEGRKKDAGAPQKYPNGLGMTDEQVEDGLRFLQKWHRENGGLDEINERRRREGLPPLTYDAEGNWVVA